MAMDKDIFGYERKSPSAVFGADAATLTISGNDAPGLLIQNWTFNYSHDVQEIFEVGSSNLYWVKGHPIGNGTLGRIIGQDLLFFDSDAYDVCTGGADMDVALGLSSCDTEQQFTPVDTGNIHLMGVIVTDIGFNMTAGDVKIGQDLTIKFAGLSI